MTIRFRQLLKREWLVKRSSPSEWLYPLVLFFIIIVLFPLAIGANKAVLQQVAVAAVWIATLLSLLIGSDGLFRSAMDNGTLALLIATKASLTQWVLCRLLVHWLTSAMTMAVLSLSVIFLFELTLYQAAILAMSIVLGSPLLLLLTATASALAVASREAAMLVPLISLPLQLPVLIFATGAVDIYQTGFNPYPILALLLAGSLLGLVSLPLVIAWVLRLAWSN